jgi:peptidoglycan/LPS O-acetylase OafA/YrhL
MAALDLPLESKAPRGPFRRSSLPSSGRIPALDGLRAIAISLVVAYHATNGLEGNSPAQNLFLRLAGQGWMGVDVFFVLSGFLITGILIDTKDRPGMLRAFYARRFLRIVPVYVVFLLFSLFVAERLGTSSADEAAQLLATQAWYWTFAVNVLIAVKDWGAVTLPTGHLWSLGVEEQFYALWPIAVVLLSPSALRRTTIACVLMAEILRVVLVLGGASGQVNFVLLPTRMDLLAAGAYLACVFRDEHLWRRVSAARQVLTLGALLLFLVTILYRHTLDSRDGFDQIVLFPAIVSLSTVFVARSAAGWSLLEGSVLRGIGKISYGMYIWHVVALRLVIATLELPSMHFPAGYWEICIARIFFTFTVTVILALISWFVIELPFLRLKTTIP